MKKIVYIILFLEIIFLVFYFLKYKQPKPFIIPQNKNNYIISKIADINTFNEPKPKKVITSVASWVSNPGQNTINNDTLNERYDYSVIKPKNTYRIIALGDSFTYGLFIDTQYNYPEQLEDFLNEKLLCGNIEKFEVINLGVGGYDAEFSYYRFEKRGRKYNPDFVIWFLKNDDFDQLKKEQDKLIGENAEMLKKNPKLADKYLEQKKYYPWTEMAKEKVSTVLGTNTIVDHQKSIVQNLSDELKNKLLLISLPSLDKEKKDFFNVLKEKNKTYFKEIVDIYKYKKTSFIDTHPNKNGYELIAHDIYSFMRSNIIPCQKK